ncbi:hypothetical protein HNQ80_004616 [Anaerosolibacter carboniphilus]|uniref:DUF4340 domain-containing protein n=1 Tax=Anaerosolibacter carboniphilus TaxID=1417629 RepID=A0A841L5S2_9FIRM|nr:hypothetical protein [Anaerosolibacter carboniphilus]MBB6218452.1 hypothetical protein [Anaerosolibacter carboniphilus]
MRNQRKQFSILWIFVVFLMVLSGGITYKLILNKQVSNKEITNLPLETNVAGGKTSKNVKEMEINEMLEGAKDIFVESYYGSDDMIELGMEEGKEILEMLKSLKLERTNLTQEDEQYDYILHIKSNNMKIKIGSPFIFIEDMNGNWLALQGQEKYVEELKTSIEEIYMEKYHQSDLFANPEAITVTAEDEGYRWDVEQKDLEEFMDRIFLKTPMNEGEATFVLAEYPDYTIQIKTSQQIYNVHLINREILTVDSQNQFAYYQYDSKLWDFIVKKYPVQLKVKESDLKSLLKAKKITVDDKKNDYDLEDGSYYHKAIARTILRARPKEITDMDQQLPWAFILTFEIGGKNKVVYIYNDYIVFEGKYYYSQRIDEAIRSTVGVH